MRFLGAKDHVLAAPRDAGCAPRQGNSRCSRACPSNLCLTDRQVIIPNITCRPPKWSRFGARLDGWVSHPLFRPERGSRFLEFDRARARRGKRPAAGRPRPRDLAEPGRPRAGTGSPAALARAARGRARFGGRESAAPARVVPGLRARELGPSPDLRGSRQAQALEFTGAGAAQVLPGRRGGRGSARAALLESLEHAGIGADPDRGSAGPVRLRGGLHAGGRRADSTGR
jgi:hypothetical protein